ncbi:hypothetical protein E0Z10_g8993 [Xylaria hypoxylon]|uniref:T6SS Phospholipase effector Tle1-like catalytic domain-containing protein n=1 Tax=Xylaria hypoxylon TaxID=37992 RepID=A0A4Z0Y7I9_9PEZI|nr:hypothetical protein E0Z10_g8993 [Xylaria hypoxylon]
MDPRTKLREQDLPATESQILTGVLDHSNDLINRLVGMDGRMKWSENESDVTPKLFREIDKEVGKRRLFVCCDGTWVNASGTTAPLTNVARFARAIDRFGLNLDYPGSPVTQVIYYSAGIGSEPVLKTRVDSIYSGITGAGLEEDILNAYCFLCNNYNFNAQNDEIILIGFSRGAFTIRCLADFISQVGLLQRKALPFLSVLFQRWMDAKEEEDRRRMKVEIRKMSQEFSLPVKITVLAEWDTVSAIGHIGWRKKFSFMKEMVPENVQNAFLAIALNERRGSFKPMVYTRARRGTNVSQCAFAGCHADIGGGNLDAGLSTVSLLWMAAKVQGACQASFDQGALLQMVQPPRPNTKWWYGRKVDETVAMNLLWSKGHINESLQGVWYIPHVLTLGWSSGSRRRHFRKTFKRQEHHERREQMDQRELNTQHNPVQIKPFAKLYSANYDCENSNDVIKIVSEDVTGRIRDSITRAGKVNATEFLTATVKTAIHVRDTDSSETKIAAVIDATFKTCPDKKEAPADQHNITQFSNAMIETALEENETKQDYIECHLKIHFTVMELVKELRYKSKEGTLEGLSEKLGWLGHERNQLVDYLPQESYDDNERRLWEEWKSQVDMWHASNEGRKGGWDKDVTYWSDVLARFDKGDTPDSQARKDMVQWEVCTDQLCRVADATAATAQAGLQTAAANVAEAENEMEFAARTVTNVAEIAEGLKSSEDDMMKNVWSIMDEVKGALGRVPVEMLTGTLVKVVAGVAQTVTGGEAKGSDSALSEAESSDKDVQTAIRSATGQLAGIAGVLAQTLYSPPSPSTSPATHDKEDNGDGDDDDDDDWRDKMSKAKEAADRMVEIAKVLQNVTVPDTDSWEEMKSYAVRAKEAAERAAKSIANATIQWKLTDEQRSEALCYRITYPSLDPVGGEGEKHQ